MKKWTAFTLVVAVWICLMYFPNSLGAGISNGFSAINQAIVSTFAPIASTPALTLNGAAFTSGSATTAKATLMIEPSGTTSTGWNTGGNYIGLNAPSAFSGRMLVILSDGVEQMWFSRTGLTTNGSGGIFAATGISARNYDTNTNCSSSAAPAVCAAAAAGSVVIAAAGTTVTVNTTRVTANSQIFVQQDDGLGTKLSVTCFTTSNTNPRVTARVAATSFTITATAGSVNPVCYSYFIVN